MSFVIGILQNKILLIKDSQQDMFLQCNSDLGKFYSEHGMHFSLFIQSLYIYEYESKWIEFHQVSCERLYCKYEIPT